MIRTRDRTRGGGSLAAWYLSGKADNTDPSFWADFANDRYAVNGAEASFSDILTFTRSTTGTYFDSNGVMQTAAINEPRFDHDPVTHAPKGILIEEQRTNLLTRSSEFDNAVWGKNGVTVTANAAISPSGGATAALVIPSIATSNYKSVKQPTVSFVMGTTYIVSVYAKAAGYSYATITVDGNNGRATYNLTTGDSTSYAVAIPSSKYIGNGWWHLYFKFTAAATGVRNVWIGVVPSYSDPSNSVAGDGASGIYLWGAQFEAGTFPTSYIPTTTASVTRSADSVANTGSNTVPFSSWYNSSAGTVYTDFNYYGSDNSFPRIFDINDTVSNSNMISLLQDTSAQQASYNIYSSSVYQGMSIGAPDLRGSRRKFAGTVALNNAAAVINGGALSTDTSLAMPISLVRMDIGNAHTGTRGACLHIRELRYYPIRVSNASLQELTS